MTGTEHIEKHSAEVNENVQPQQDASVASTLEVHNETFDISPEALGTNLPPNYYLSPMFLGTVVVRHCTDPCYYMC